MEASHKGAFLFLVLEEINFYVIPAYKISTFFFFVVVL